MGSVDEVMLAIARGPLPVVGAVAQVQESESESESMDVDEEGEKGGTIKPLMRRTRGTLPVVAAVAQVQESGSESMDEDEEGEKGGTIKPSAGRTTVVPVVLTSSASSSGSGNSNSPPSVNLSSRPLRPEHGADESTLRLRSLSSHPTTNHAYMTVAGKKSKSMSNRLRSIIIPAYTSHARHLPKPSRHAFSYPLLYLGVDVDALENRELDLPGRLLGYGGQPWTKCLGLRTNGYLRPGQESLRVKAEQLLSEQGLGDVDMMSIWLVTMPSFMGFEGINPLSVWYIYSEKRELTCVILEVHNTFGEK
jgi:hypothetical protein